LDQHALHMSSEVSWSPKPPIVAIDRFALQSEASIRIVLHLWPLKTRFIIALNIEGNIWLQIVSFFTYLSSQRTAGTMWFQSWRLQRTLAGVDQRRSSRKLSEKIWLGLVEKQLRCTQIQEKIPLFAAESDSKLNFPLQC